MTVPRVDSYRFGQLVVDGVTFKQDVILLFDAIRPEWRRREGHRLHPDDLADVFAVGPEVLVVGQGASGLVVHLDRQTSPNLPDTKIRALI